LSCNGYSAGKYSSEGGSIRQLFASIRASNKANGRSITVGPYGKEAFMLPHTPEYVDQDQDYYERRYRDRVTKKLKKRAASLGFDLVPKQQDENMPDALLSTT
jgi:hypothetical protein